MGLKPIPHSTCLASPCSLGPATPRPPVPVVPVLPAHALQLAEASWPEATCLVHPGWGGKLSPLTQNTSIQAAIQDSTALALRQIVSVDSFPSGGGTPSSFATASTKQQYTRVLMASLTGYPRTCSLEGGSHPLCVVPFLFLSK